MRKIAMLCFLGLVLNLSACLEMNQEIWIDPSGSGRLKMDIAIDKNVYDQLSSLRKMNNPDAAGADMFGDVVSQKDEIAKNPDVTKIDIQKVSDEKAYHLVIDVSVKDFQKLNEMGKLLGENKNKPENQSQVSDDSQFNFKKVADNTIDFSLLLKGKAANSEEMDANNQMMQAMFAGKNFTTTLHAPQIVSSNGTKIDAQTVQWKMLMTDRMTQKEDKTWQAQIKLVQPGFFQGLIDTIKGWF